MEKNEEGPIPGEVDDEWKRNVRRLGDRIVMETDNILTELKDNI